MTLFGAPVTGFWLTSRTLAITSSRVATFVDKILKGAKPADLPVEHRQSSSSSQVIE